MSDKDLENENDDCYQAKLTLAGLKKLAMKRYGSKIAFVGGTDYLVKEEGGQSWIEFQIHLT